MAVPVGQKVYVTLESGDVIHAWYVPRFLFKRDVVPGQINHFEFTVDEAEAARSSTASARALRHRPSRHAVRRPRDDPADYDAWLQALIEQANATPPPAPSGATTLDGCRTRRC